MRITIQGHIPGKKNAYRQAKNGRRFKDAATVRQLNDITRQILMQTGNLEPFQRPTIKAHFVCSDARSDLDNKWTALQDCLVKAGIIENDNLAHLPGPITISGTVERGEEFTIVELSI